ncbi:MAG TPA: DUF4349 domain-containing protein [Anaerolineales bacterium]|nr:DUF4349 domain-containing protein [Anaerolineales bacterium]
MKRLFALIAILSILFLTACSALQRSSRELTPSVAPAPEVPAYTLDNSAGAPAAPEALTDSGKAAGGAPSVAAANAPADTGRLVIQTAQLAIVVSDVAARVQAIQNMAKSMGGFLVSLNMSEIPYGDGTEQVPQAQIVVRVPQEKLDEALAQIKKDTVDVQNETRSGTDVTDQYVDLQSRLTAKQAAEAQLTQIMQDATRTQDVLDVYSQLQQVQSDIEVLKGQIKYYEQSAALSAITVNVIAEQTVKPLEVGGWKPQGVARDALQRLIKFWQSFVNFLINLVLLYLPVLITIAIPVVLALLLMRWILRKTRRLKTALPAEPQDK